MYAFSMEPLKSCVRTLFWKRIVFSTLVIIDSCYQFFAFINIRELEGESEIDTDIDRRKKNHYKLQDVHVLSN